MISSEIIGFTVIACSAFYIPVFWRALQKERKLTQDGKAILEVQKGLLAEERRNFFRMLQEKASANAVVPCRTCSVCKRVVHRYRALADGYICKECDVESKVTR